MRLAFIITSLFFLFQSLYGYEPNRDYHFRHYTNKHGLSHNTVYCSLQDQKGFMWFGTDDGLNRFDGQSFKVYRYNSSSPHSEGLPNDRIVHLFEDTSGRIWICTLNGTCYYDYQTDTFHPLPFHSEEKSLDYFHAITEDNQGKLWFAGNKQIVVYNPTDTEVKSYPTEETLFPHLMTRTENGFPLFADEYNLYHYKSETDRFIPIPILTEDEQQTLVHLSAICPVTTVGILLGTNKAGLKLLHASTGQIETIIPDIQVRAITPYNNVTYWIASESGLYIYNIIDKKILHLQKSLTNEYAISDNAIYSITKDREGGMWLGSFFGGISYLPQRYTRFNNYIGGKTHPDMLGNAVREICPDQYGHIWLGTEDNGINRYNPVTGEMINYSLNNPINRLSATNIHGLYADEDKLWIGTFNRGIEVLDITTGKRVKQYTQIRTSQTPIENFILCFFKTRKGDFFVGTSSGPVLYEQESDTFIPWSNIGALVRQFYEDRNGTLWLATTNGIYNYRPENNKLTHYSSSDPNSGLGSNNTTSVFEDSKGNIWITTMYGFSRYNADTDNFIHITTQHGLPSNITYRIEEDCNGFFWISTANGLVRFHPETCNIRTFTGSDGLHETQFNYSSSYKANDGTIYMGTINGMVSFKPQYFKEDLFVPPVYITRIHIPESKEKQSINHLLSDSTVQLKLPYNSSTFTITYQAVSYTSPDAIRYAYMLEGVDNDWIEMGKNKEITFANLSPGKYRFKVRSTNSSNLWQANTQTLQIVITPPFWITPWAFVIYLLLIVCCVILFYRYKKRKLEIQHKLNQELFENEKEKELYHAKIQFFTFITHEIRTPLTLIKAPLEKIRHSGDGSPATKKNLKTIETNTQRLLDLSNQLLDFRKTESRGFLLNYVKTDVLLWVDTIIQPFLPLFEKEEKTIHIQLPQDRFIAYIDREAFSKIVSNLLTNAIKYSDKKISIRLTTPENNFFSLLVTNDGYLIPQSEEEKIFSPFYRLKETENMQGSGIGLSLSRSLAEFHKGTLSYQQTADQLNQFILTLPVEQEEYCFDIDLLTAPTKEVRKSVSVSSDKPIVLIVEDQKEMRQFIAEELALSYEIVEAENGQIALERLENNPVHLIISDVMMPVMDGFELCNTVKNNIHFSHIPFILLTAQHNLQSRLKGLNKGADAYLEKPFSLELLTAQIQNLLKSREILHKTYLEAPLIPSASLANTPLDNLFLSKLNTYLEENITNENLNVESIAAEMGLSTSSLYRKVKGLANISPVDFIRITRLKKAVQLMQSGEKRISEIAYKVGFSSPAYFSTCFQKQYGKSPSEFIKELENIS
ncbi:hybrid sensor histidine kinase/response regulator transcription factor [Parabacteroides sp. PF5-9]|uniref:hybrid sensor histidine kinase/response regulator transcription factor n=1 Tax=Parabacteroides sp. PF5-9 TaxID=1742404 RepID=UPI0024754029|nr:hybrid sensor histidine kinase/response regulator transcription factor [Parabacteroides sp. PF5-9]MDH6358080.1 ligand-binding sensor domain-containing protein/signal transduction histidine kinase/DNA-binding response OmpR family regulator [Parabacteroides sp. PF5-9]